MAGRRHLRETGVARRVVHFLLHVPKCAGTTVEEHFERHLGPGFLRAPRWESPLRDVMGNRYPYAPGDPRLDGVRVVSGHSLSVSLMRAFAGAEIRESVLLRDPVGYHLSLYNYRWARHEEGFGPPPPAFGRWYRAQRRNPVSRFLLARYFEQGVPALYRLSSAGRLAFLEARLARFHFVGDYRRARELIAGVSRELGIEAAVEDRNVTRERRMTAESLGAEWVARIERDHALDAALHARWADRGRADAASRGAGLPGGSTPGQAARAAGGAARSPRRPALPALDQGRYLAGDLVTGIAKKLIR
jgi:hypothetical protein